MIIMLSGAAGSGKDTACRIIRRSWNYPKAERFAFADALKATATNLTWDGTKDVRGRKFLQDLGRAARAYNPDVWVNIVANEIQATQPEIAIITDFRYPNEAAVMKEKFGDVFTVRLTGRATDLQTNKKDSSEHALDNYTFDYYICNNGSLAEFEAKLMYMMKNRLGL